MTMSQKERREHFRELVAGPLAAAVASELDLGAAPQDHSTECRVLVPAYTAFFDCGDALLVALCPGERWQNVEQALAYGLAHADGRRMELILPEWKPVGLPDPVRATTIRAAFLRQGIQVWTHDGAKAHRVDPLTREQACEMMREKKLAHGLFDVATLAPRVRALAELADEDRHLSYHHRKSYWGLKCQGVQVLNVRRAGKGFEVRAGVDYTMPVQTQQKALLIHVKDGEDLTEAQFTEVLSSGSGWIPLRWFG